jgi:hypothetical protein
MIDSSFLKAYETMFVSIRERNSTWKSPKVIQTGIVYDEALEQIEADSGKLKSNALMFSPDNIMLADDYSITSVVDYLLLSHPEVKITFAKVPLSDVCSFLNISLTLLQESDLNRIQALGGALNLVGKHKSIIQRMEYLSKYIGFVLNQANNLSRVQLKTSFNTCLENILTLISMTLRTILHSSWLSAFWKRFTQLVKLFLFVRNHTDSHHRHLRNGRRCTQP